MSVSLSQWAASDDPMAMRGLLLGAAVATPRKLRLFACACARVLWGPLLVDPKALVAVGVAEEVADGMHGGKVPGGVVEGITGSRLAGRQCSVAGLCVMDDPYDCYETALRYSPVRHPRDGGGDPREGAAKAALLRDAFGDLEPLPWMAVGEPPPDAGSLRGRRRWFLRRWRGPDALRVARCAYEERDWGALPVLADALEESGCDSEPVLRHLRGRGPHARGCWALDLILGRS